MSEIQEPAVPSDAPPESAKRTPNTETLWWMTSELVVAFIIVFLWVIVYELGLVVGTQKIRDDVSAYFNRNQPKTEQSEKDKQQGAPSNDPNNENKEHGKGWVVEQMLWLIFCHTALNLTWLSGLSCVLGGFIRRFGEGTDSLFSRRHCFGKFILYRFTLGLAVYLAIVVGLVSIGGVTFERADHKNHEKLSIICAFFCIIVGYRPDLFITAIRKLEQTIGFPRSLEISPKQA